jgi:prepilin-type processing-associated H-X9-DG protein
MVGALHATSTPYPPGLSNNAPDNCTYKQGQPWTNPVTGQRYIMTQLGTRVSDITDGLSNTFAIAEDTGRNENMEANFGDPVSPNGLPGNRRAHWRWAEPDNGFGVSGDPLGTKDQFGTPQTGYGATIRAINNNATPYGGGICSWNLGYAAAGGPPPLAGYTGGPNNNCGPNEEIFSFHGNGANAGFMDGHVSFLSADINPVVIRYLTTSQEGIAIPPGTDY